MANEHNLIPAAPGEVRNPYGRGKGVKNRSTILKEFLALKAAGVNFKNIKINDLDLPDGLTYEQAVNFKLMDVALDGDITAIKEIQDTLHGKIVDKVHTEHSFTQMGKVEAAPVDAIEGSSERVAISFDVGEDVKTPVDQT